MCHFIYASSSWHVYHLTPTNAHLRLILSMCWPFLSNWLMPTIYSLAINFCPSTPTPTTAFLKFSCIHTGVQRNPTLLSTNSYQPNHVATPSLHLGQSMLSCGHHSLVLPLSYFNVLICWNDDEHHTHTNKSLFVLTLFFPFSSESLTAQHLFPQSPPLMIWLSNHA